MRLPPVGRTRELKQKAAVENKLVDHLAEAKARAKADDGSKAYPFGKPPVPVKDRKIKVDVGAMEVTITPGPDQVFGTADDTHVIKPKKRAKKLVSSKMTVAELKALATKHKITLPAKARKAEIISYLEDKLS